MVNFKKIIAGLAISITLVTAAQAETTTLRFQHFISPKGAVPSQFMTPWVKKIEEESKGRLKIEIYPAMQLGGSPTALFDQIRDNVIDGGWAIPGYTPGRFPAAEVFELPFMGTKSAESTSQAQWEFYEKYLTKTFDEIKVLAVHTHGPGVIHTKKSKAVNSLVDMKGLKLRAPTRIAGKLLKAAGSAAIGMPVPAFPEAMSKGVVDGGVIPWEIVLPLKLNELAANHTEMAGDRGLYNMVFIWGMNKDVYNKLPKDLQKVMDDNSGMMASAWAGRAMDAGDVPGRKVTKAGGNNIITLTDAQTNEFKELADPIVAAWIKDMTKKGYPAEAMIKDARSMVKKYDK